MAVLNEPAGLAMHHMAMSGYDREPSASASEPASEAAGETVQTASSAQTPATPDICYYDETELLGTIRRDELGGETHIAADLGAARNTDERMRLVRGMLRLVGFSELGYLTVRLDPQGRPERLYFPRSYLSANLAPHYFEAGYHRHDPRFAWALAGNTPHVWDLRRLVDAWRRAGSPPGMRTMFDEMREAGIGSGLIFGLPIPHTRLRSIISFAAPSEQAGWITDSVVVQSLTLGLSVHQRFSAYVRAINRHESAAELSELQMRILGFLAAGLSDKEIALRMHTTAHNVDYHLRRLRQKCGVTNRTQLAFLAGQLPTS
jgi:DNA-binding CsgD family transcriptional regulator